MTGSELPEGPPTESDPSRRAAESARWVLSPLDYHAHVLTGGDQPLGVVRARCGALLPMVVTEYEGPTGQKCRACELILRVDLDAPGRFASTSQDSSGVIRCPSAGLWV